MTDSKNIVNKKRISVATGILAALWHLKESSRFRIFNHRYFKTLCHEKHHGTRRSSISRLCKANIIRKDVNDIYLLTESGRKNALLAFIEAELALHSLTRETKWDGGWRIIFFDIPETKRKYRDHLRRVIKSVGFYEFQKSIWVYPYPVPQFLRDLIYEENIRPHVSLVTTNLLDDDTKLRQVFGLSRK